MGRKQRQQHRRQQAAIGEIGGEHARDLPFSVCPAAREPARAHQAAIEAEDEGQGRACAAERHQRPRPTVPPQREGEIRLEKGEAFALPCRRAAPTSRAMGGANIEPHRLSANGATTSRNENSPKAVARQRVQEDQCGDEMRRRDADRPEGGERVTGTRRSEIGGDALPVVCRHAVRRSPAPAPDRSSPRPTSRDSPAAMQMRCCVSSAKTASGLVTA